jgi:hypothetical protein
MPHCIPSARQYPDLQHQQDLERLGNEITELAAHIHAATFQLLELVRLFDEEQGWGSDGVNSCAHWLNWKCGMNIGAAREKVRVSHALPDLPQISAAFREGRISYSKVRAMRRVATRQNEEYLLMIARHGTAAHVERLVSAYRGADRIKAMELENIRHAQRELSWFTDGRAMQPGPDARFRGNGLALIHTNRENGLHIDATTLPPNWTGERMDLNMAVCGLQASSKDGRGSCL